MLRVLIDGQPMPPEEARAFWQRFSDHMEEHRGDLAGFAAKEGFASVQPVVGGEGPELHVSRTATQAPYTTAPKQRSKDGLTGVHENRSRAGRGTRKHGKKR